MFVHFLIFLFIFIFLIFGQILDNSELIFKNIFWFSFKSRSEYIADTGHSGTQIAQSIHKSSFITKKLLPSLKQSTGQTLTQSVYLHFMQFSVIIYVMGVQKSKKSISKKNKRLSLKFYNKNISLFVNKENKKIHLRHHFILN